MRLPGIVRLRKSPFVSALTLLAAVSVGCSDGPFRPFTTGALRVLVETTGGDLDLDGYVLTVDGAASPIAINGALRFEDLDEGLHGVALAGLAPNCAVLGDNPRDVLVEAGATVDAAFSIVCAATGVWIVITTTGLDLPTSFGVSLDAAPPTTIPANSSASISRLAAGAHSVALSGVGDNCTVAGSNPLSVDLTSGQTLVVSFTVSCTASTANIVVSTATSGLDLPTSAYVLRVDGNTAGSVASNGSVVIGGLPGGDRTVELAAVPANCAVADPNPVTVGLATGGMTRDTADVAFTISCVRSGSIEVITATSGFDRPRGDYSVRLDDVIEDSVPSGGSMVIDGVLPGDHTVELAAVPTNCMVVGGNPVTVAVTTSDVTRDTAQVAFEVDCAKVWGLAFTRVRPGDDGEAPAIYVARADGSDTAFVAWGNEADWSPDGASLAFAACNWSSYYGYYGDYWSCYPTGLSIAGTESPDVTALTSDASDTDPSWRPDGAKIAFARGGRLYLIDSDGSALAPVPLPAAVGAAFHPSWSPDGSTLALTCELEAGNSDICLVKPDGTGFLRLTDDPGREARPAWRPNGSSIAFTATALGGATEIALVAPDGSGLTRLSPGTGALRPAWSTDGATLAFVGITCNIYSGCRTLGLFRMNADGTGVTQLTAAGDDAPAWRP